jgi:2-haloacid dehalogenase/putative hydrolase of the HAD superfamily
VTRRFDVVTFDCYGTLVDWDGGISGAIVREAAATGLELDRAAVIDAYHAIEPQVEAGPYEPYRRVLERTAIEVARRFGWELTRAAAGFLASGIGEWPLFADTRPALERLRANGYRLGILSNVDRDLLERTIAGLGLGFDLIVTAEDVRSYKPDHGHFRAARRIVGDARWLHAAQSWFHDVVPASECGIPVVWINRKNERPGAGGRPERELPALADLADWLAG